MAEEAEEVMGKQRLSDQAGSAALEALLDEILTDAHGDDEQLWALRQAFEDNVELPADAFIIGEPVSVIEIDYDGNEKFGRLLGTVHTLRRRHWWSCWEPDVNVADRLLQEGMVVEYSGAAKVEFSEEQLRHIVAGRSLPLSASEEG